ncbi:MAG: 4Fe-4S binding protein [Pseudomonadota bacterium]|nr:4Fe-4S binding protein [Pseudomonadota bacterium]
MRAYLWIFLMACLAAVPMNGRAEPLERAALADLVRAPYALGEATPDAGVWTLLNSGGAQVGYVFETEPLAPLPGFSGAPINMLVTMDMDGRLIEVRLLEHNEPIFVSGLGQAPFEGFVQQYAGHSITTPMVVGNPYGNASGDGSALVYLDGVTKATASVRIAHESVIAAARAVARDRLEGISSEPPARPDLTYREDLDWQALVDQGIASHHVVTNAEVDAAFADTIWARDDPEASADPEGRYLDLWIVDLGPPSVAQAVLSEGTLAELERFRAVSGDDEPILVIETARHGLVGEDFVRNTAPDLISAEQDGLPVALRDADLFITLQPGVPEGRALILRSDRRLGFDPARPWVMKVEAVRQHGMFQPEVGRVTLEAPHETPERFFTRPEAPRIVSPAEQAVRDRLADLVGLAVFLVALMAVLFFAQSRLAGHRRFTPIRLGILAFVTGFVGWWGQGQLSIVTVLGTLRGVTEGKSLSFLLYDPFSLLVWGAAIIGFVLWGRGLFCGWLCPFGALQEFAHHIGRWLRLPRIEPSAIWDARLKMVKYVLLFGLVVVTFVAPSEIDTFAEVEPFKTAITTHFVRDWYYVVYAGFWLVLGTMTFKGFCRYVCPLGAVMAIGGLLRGRAWIERRVECGSPCQLCKVRCNYGAIKQDGRIGYDECFQCLDCVTIHDDAEQCVPLVLAAKRQRRAA